METGQNDAKFDVAVGEKPSSKKSTGLIRLEFAKKTGGKKHLNSGGMKLTVHSDLKQDIQVA